MRAAVPKWSPGASRVGVAVTDLEDQESRLTWAFTQAKRLLCPSG